MENLEIILSIVASGLSIASIFLSTSTYKKVKKMTNKSEINNNELQNSSINSINSGDKSNNTIGDNNSIDRND